MQRYITLILLVVGCLGGNSCHRSMVNESDRDNFLDRYIAKFHPQNLSDTLEHITSLDEIFNLNDTALNLLNADKKFMEARIIGR